MSYFADTREVGDVFRALFEQFLGSEDGEAVAELATALPVCAVLELHLTDPGAPFAIDFAARTVSRDPAQEASVRLEIEASTLHDVLLGRLDPVQLSRAFEEDRAAIEGAPEALVGCIRVAGLLATHYPAVLQGLGRSDLLETPRPPNGAVWSSEGPPKLVIGKRRPWQERKRETAAAG